MLDSFNAIQDRDDEQTSAVSAAMPKIVAQSEKATGRTKVQIKGQARLDLGDMPIEDSGKDRR